ncbi:ATP-binding cassette domain-containing protein [Fluviispira vulneris]|uniref:ATP-binding cassette domain-containing protein n=1 Tax=Fluviispira vulneris TaxID=2763012 RepID=UPI001647B03C|nr:ATP-binding cassette domain-containing protein [Fluviispira vulneris]
MIEVNNLKLYGKTQNLRLEIPQLKFHSPGITALVGHNGAGKSSLLRLMAGLDKPDLGSVIYLAKDIFKHFELLKDKIHLISWNLELYQGLTTADHLKLIKSLAENWNCEIENALLRDLAVPAHKRIDKLSRGEQVRFRLLLSLPRMPMVILLDEVTNELDTDSRRTIFKKLDAYSYETGAQVVVATNMIEDIERYATDIILLKKGKVILQSALDAIKEEHKTSFEEIMRIYERKDC